MNAPLPIPREVRDKQIEASNPRTSAWIAAHAGSGKTHVLAQRVIRLLLDGCNPSRILCLTFTKAAAANMAKRVFDTLAKWIALDDLALDVELRGLGADHVDAGLRAHARRLFAAALETPGGLKVQTIHAFCTRLLHQFPFEANVAARFTVLEERAQAELIDRLRLDVLLKAAAEPDSSLGKALAIAITAVADSTFAEIMRETIADRDGVMAWIDRPDGAPEAFAELSRMLGVEPTDSREAVESELLASPILPRSEWLAVADTLKLGSDTDCRQAEYLVAAERSGGSAGLESYLDFFCTTTERQKRKNIVTKAIAKSEPALAERLKAEQDRVCSLLARLHAVAMRDRSAALLTIAGAVVVRYRQEKARRGLLDYDDLIDATLAMLTTVNPSWVHYKLDLGIDHLLIDEAQDTSPKQWDVIELLVAEFTAGKGAREGARLIFAVGDEKQSIFSFQGAAPRYFADKRRHYETAHRDSGVPFVTLDFKYSFRSAPIVLTAVDTVFARREAFQGLTADPIPTVHQAVRDKAPGLVEVWPLAEPDETPEIEAWQAPFDTPSETAPAVKLARRIARSVGSWMDREQVADMRTGALRPIRPGDVLILVRQRGPLFTAIIRALKDAHIAVAGVDRLKLAEHIAVLDLMVLADALLLPGDDLALATVLKSPLFGFDEQALFELAWNRRGSLRDVLRRQAGANLFFAEAAARLDRWAEAARRLSPFAFYAGVLGADRGRARILARLGLEANDALDEFLNLALDYERRETPSLHGFVATLRTTQSEVKRDMEIARDEVRVMTVHGAKGLEAPVVILADTTSNPDGPYPPRLLKLSNPWRPHAPDQLVWAKAKRTDAPAAAAARERALQAAREEYRRLLYVAMTRAADRLIVCGAVGERKRPEGCWYDLVRDALEPIADKIPTEDGDILRLRQEASVGAVMAIDSTVATPAAAHPEWLGRNVEGGEAMPVPLSPSGAIEEAPASLAGADERRRALARGTLVHRLMQSLPDVPAARRAAAARRYLERAGADFTEAERDHLARQVLAVLDDPRLAPVIGAGSRAEVPIVGRIARAGRPPFAVSGQVDRLAVTPQAVFIADYKTNRPAPRRLEDVPEVVRGAACALLRSARLALSRAPRQGPPDLDRCT